ncbi:hypothetical protein C672_0579 [[Clostridium] bifermentans ATCC 638]|uniref:Uncharacterized protein n=1 Tax=Paraclostridium bifermentans ATCC 638 = DSM 14991 TaxID=1233171 RepID=T4VTG0_PARBF|nr:hypothetical protein [Paraclostridium bifermentans]EQK44051.1 hypothetical protein C672_0579 [[Clostridium] bifermentans ATCC 638] [Paraclostridium bifermentans ATCC 638 = DSM 14991]RIZ58544.1 hypothetical protein CHH45_10565 [Paraclostridium bifermentans]UAG19791.1 hypothetical protein KXZ80_16640 [Paraclostridium bifermentans]
MSELNIWMDFINTECDIEFMHQDDIYIVKDINNQKHIVKNEYFLPDVYSIEEVLEKMSIDNKCLKNLIEENHVKILSIF